METKQVLVQGRWETQGPCKVCGQVGSKRGNGDIVCDKDACLVTVFGREQLEEDSNTPNFV